MSEIRSVSVHLDADVASYVAKMRLAGAETDRAFASSSRHIDSTNRSLSTTESTLGKVDTQARKVDTSTSKLNRTLDNGGRSIDRYSGRLSLLADAGLVLGTISIPGITTALAGGAGLGQALGFTVLGVAGVVTAFQGFGKTLQTVNKAALEPTPQNLEAARIAMQQLGPEGRDLIHTIRGLGDEWRGTQEIARRGLFPGVDAGIRHLEDRLPQIQVIITEVDRTLGHLAADTGRDLASKRWDPFFNFLQGDARRILAQTGHSVLNLAHAVGTLIVGFSPVSNDFTRGLLHASHDFDQASSNFVDSQKFTELLDYIETNGPLTLATLGKIGNAFLQIGEAAAPLGGPTLTILGDVADVVAHIADSDFGTPLIIGLTALRLYSRTQQLLGAEATRSFGQIVTGQKRVDSGYTRLSSKAKTFASDVVLTAKYGKLATEQSARLTEQAKTAGRTAALLGAVAIASTGAADGIGLTNTATLGLAGSIAGAPGIVIGTSVGLYQDIAGSAHDAADSVTSYYETIGRATTARQIDQATEQLQKYADARKSTVSGKIANVLVGEQDQFAAAAAAGAREARQLREGAVGGQQALDVLFSPALGRTSHALDVATASEQQFTSEFQHMSNVLSGRASFRDFRASIDAVTASLKENGKGLSSFTVGGRANQAVLDQIATSGLGFAKTLRGNDRTDFLARLRKDLIETNIRLGGSKKTAEAYVNSLKDLNGLDPKVKVDADTKPAHAKVEGTKKELHALTHQPFDVLVNADKKAAEASLAALRSQVFDLTSPGHVVNVKANTRPALSDLRQVAAELASLHDRTIDITTRRVTSGHSVAGNADGATIPKTGLGYADRHLRLLADGEEVISNRYGQADLNRPALKAANRGARLAVVGMTEGGTAGGRYAGVRASTSYSSRTVERVVERLPSSLRLAVAADGGLVALIDNVAQGNYEANNNFERDMSGG